MTFAAPKAEDDPMLAWCIAHVPPQAVEWISGLDRVPNEAVCHVLMEPWRTGRWPVLPPESARDLAYQAEEVLQLAANSDPYPDPDPDAHLRVPGCVFALAAWFQWMTEPGSWLFIDMGGGAKLGMLIDHAMRLGPDATVAAHHFLQRISSSPRRVVSPLFLELADLLLSEALGLRSQPWSQAGLESFIRHVDRSMLGHEPQYPWLLALLDPGDNFGWRSALGRLIAARGSSLDPNIRWLCDLISDWPRYHPA